MYINEISIRNFRILSESQMDFGNDLCLMIGKNNTGKTSFLVLFEKFLGQLSFDFNDFSLKLRDKILTIDSNTDETELSIQLILNIQYEDSDDLCNISEFIVDLDPTRKDVHLLFECEIKKDKLLEDIKNAGKITKEKFIKKYLCDYLEKNIYTFNDLSDISKENRHRLIKKSFKDVNKLIDFEIIHAKRSVSSSEEKHGAKVLSGLTTSFFNSQNINTPDKFEKINELMETMDTNLDDNYESFFSSFLKTAKDFLGMGELKVKSNLKASEIVTDASEVVYGDDKTQLPEYLNGLGHMNILYLLLNIEIKKNRFLTNKKDIKLLFIEEPEAHTHPQLQYIFARKISEIVSGIPGMQTIITTHSSHIVASHPFENIRYMSTIRDSEGFYNIEIKNFHKDLSSMYSGEQNEFKFLKQYLSIESSELFFADKAIFIEGISEDILLQHFITQFDTVKIEEEETRIANDPTLKPTYIPLSAQNVTVVRAGANAKVFRHFLEFLKIPSLIITDIDTVKQETTDKGVWYSSCEVNDSNVCKTSNATIMYYLGEPNCKVGDDSYSSWFNDVLKHKANCISPNVHIAYQGEEKSYYARSFEDAFINVNLSQIKSNLSSIEGLKNKEEFETCSDMYKLTTRVISKKSDFASTILFLTHANGLNWNTPAYIKEGLEWLQKQVH
ncbi:MAG: AAA family ATPase [Clostridiales bacterium]|nr:AAA family ATPase [Clostridiales bacterium]